MASKVGGGLHFVDGPQGHGKSLYGVRLMTDFLMSRQYVVTNIALLPGAFERMARHDPGTYWPYPTFKEQARKLESCYVFTEDLDEAMRFKIPGRTEARALFLWDESHNDLNNRNWRDDGRALLLKWATQMRKQGYTGRLLTQHVDNTDAALRRVCGWRIRMQNQKENIRVVGMRVLPVPLFLACHYPANSPLKPGVKPEFVQRFFLTWTRKLYDTHAISHGLEEELALAGAPIVLPKPGTWRKGATEPGSLESEAAS